MNTGLYEAFGAQLRDVHIQIAMARAEIEETEISEDRERAVCLRDKITELEKFIETIRHSQAAILLAESELEKKVAQFVEWRSLVAEIRAKAAEFDKAALRVPPATEEMNIARGLAQNARDELQIHGANKPGPLALQKEIIAFDRETARLQTVVDSLTSELQKAVYREGQARATALKLRDELSKLGWRENNLRPTSLRPTLQGGGLFRVAL